MSREKRDHFVFELHNSPSSRTGKAIRVTSPDKVLRIHNVDDLKSQLEHYAHPLIKQTSPDSKFARRWYVEKIRPALRYYCLKYSVKVPSWLKDDEYYLGLTDREKQDLFGTTKLKPREFSKLKTFPGGEVVQ